MRRAFSFFPLDPTQGLWFPAGALLSSGLVLTALTACMPVADGGEPTEPVVPTFEHAHTLALGAVDNVEVVQVVPGRAEAVAVSSKARRLTHVVIDLEQGGLAEERAATLFAEDASESELTHLAIAPDGTWGVLTRTAIEVGTDEQVVSCGGSLVFVSLGADTFGEILQEVTVGPMPDAVAVSPDGQWVASANERDVVWGKCETVLDLAPPSVSLLDVSGGPALAVERSRLEMSEVDREPESLTFSRDGARLVVTLQDTHEVLALDVALFAASAAPSESEGRVTSLPASSLDLEAWPDGVTRVAGDGPALFAVAGEANDMLYLLDDSGSTTSSLEVDASRIPEDFPRDGTWGPLFRPDSIASFAFGDRRLVVSSLKASGAVALLDATDGAAPEWLQVVKVGADEQASPTEESSVGSEGIAASSDFGFVVVANELESSLSLLLPLSD